MLLLPHHYEFAETLANIPFFFQSLASETCEVLHVVQQKPNYLPEIVNANNLQEYLLGGEADQFIEYVDGYADTEDTETEDEQTDSNLLSIPSWELSDEWLGSI
jgi:hypothetical protein